MWIHVTDEHHTPHHTHTHRNTHTHTHTPTHTHARTLTHTHTHNHTHTHTHTLRLLVVPRWQLQRLLQPTLTTASCNFWAMAAVSHLKPRPFAATLHAMVCTSLSRARLRNGAIHSFLHPSDAVFVCKSCKVSSTANDTCNVSFRTISCKVQTNITNLSLLNYCTHLCRPGISAVAAAHDAFMRNEPPPEASDAAWLLDFYSSFIGDTCDALDTTHRALECLAQACSSLN